MLWQIGTLTNHHHNYDNEQIGVLRGKGGGRTGEIGEGRQKCEKRNKSNSALLSNTSK